MTREIGIPINKNYERREIINDVAERINVDKLERQVENIIRQMLYEKIKRSENTKYNSFKLNKGNNH